MVAMLILYQVLFIADLCINSGYLLIYSFLGAAAPTWRFYQRMSDLMGHRPCANNISNAIDEVDRQGTKNL